MDSTDAYSNDYEEVLRKALERIKELKEENHALSSELATVSGQATSSQFNQSKMEQLEQENQHLTAELETTRKKLQALRDIATKSFADLKQEAQHLNKKLEAAWTVLDLYELLYDAPTPHVRLERPDGRTIARATQEDGYEKLHEDQAVDSRSGIGAIVGEGPSTGSSTSLPIETPVLASKPFGEQFMNPELGSTAKSTYDWAQDEEDARRAARPEQEGANSVTNGTSELRGQRSTDTFHDTGIADTRDPALRREPLETHGAERSDERGHGIVKLFPVAREWVEQRSPRQLEIASEQHTYDDSCLSPSPVAPPPPVPSEEPPVASSSPAVPSRPEASCEALADEFAGLGSEDEEIQVIVSPFSSFGTINRFTSAMRSLPGVSRATIRRFQNGKLQVSMEYAGVVPLGHRLLDLREFNVSVIDSSPGRIEAVLESVEERGHGAAGLGA